MKTIFNFSHSLSAATVGQITDAIGPVQVRDVRVQLDLNQDIEDQIYSLCAESVEGGERLW